MSRLPSTARFGLSHWLYAGVVTIVLATTVPLIYLVGHLSRTHFEQQARQELTQIAWQMRGALDRSMASRYEDVRRLSLNTTLRQRTLDTEDIRVALDRLKESFSHYAWIGLVDTRGKVLVSTDRLLEGMDVSARPWFAGGIEAPYVGDVHPAVLLAKSLPASSEPWRFVDIAMPVKDGAGKTLYVLAAHMSWSWAREIQTMQLDPEMQRQGMETMILQREGTVLLTPASQEDVALPPALMKQLTAGTRHAQVEMWPDGKRYVTSLVATQGYGRYPGLGWVVLARQPADIAYAPVHELYRALALTSTLVFAGLLLLAALFARHLSRPLVRLSEAVAQRRPDAPTLLPATGGYREAQVLRDAFQRHVDAEHAHIRELDAMNASLEARVDERATALHEANEMLTRLMHEQHMAQRDVAESESLMREILERASDAYVRMDEQGRIVEWNREAEKIFGWTRDEAVGQLLADMIIPPIHREAHQRGLRHFLATGTGPVINQRIEITALRRDGEEFPIELTVGVVRRGDAWIISGFMHDISERKAAAQALAESREQIKTITDNLPVMIGYVDRDLRYRFVNAAYRAVLRLDPAAMLGQRIDETPGRIHGPDALEAMRPQIERVLAGQRVSFERSATLEGRSLHLHTTFIPHTERTDEGRSGVAGFYVMEQDVTQQKALENSLARQALEDTLTGLPNRRAFMEHIPKAMARANRAGKPLAVLFLDLDGFKKINDSLGHEAGDELLKQFARRLGDTVRKSDLVARLAGDEFTILLEALTQGEDDALAVARKITEAMAQPFTLGGLEQMVTTSVGIALYAPHAVMTVDALLHQADVAMYVAKRAGKNQCRVHQPGD